MTPPQAAPVLGETGDDILFDDSAQCRDLALALASQAERVLRILSHDLDGNVLNNADFAAAVRHLATAHDRNRVLLLVTDPDAASKRGGRLLGLARRLSSHIELRKLSEAYAGHNESFIVADERGVLYRNLASRYEGIAQFNAPRRAAELIRFFDSAWERSQQFREFRQLQP